MKKQIRTLIRYINQVHSYPFWLFIFFLYASIVTFGASSVLSWFPHLITGENFSSVTSEILLEGGVGLFAIGCITAPVMDIILHVDIPKS